MGWQGGRIISLGLDELVDGWMNGMPWYDGIFFDGMTERVRF